MPGGEAPHSFEFVAAPTDLAPYLNSLYIWRLGDEQLDDVLPAYSGQMVVFAEGVGRMQFDDEVAETSDAFFLAPLCQARDFSVNGPAVLFGVSINFRGWAALTGLSVHDYHDCFLQPGTVLEDGTAQTLSGLAQRWRAGEVDDAANCSTRCATSFVAGCRACRNSISRSSTRRSSGCRARSSPSSMISTPVFLTRNGRRNGS